VIDVYIYGCLLMIMATIAESALIMFAHCTLEETVVEDRWECDLSAMHTYERYFAWTLLRYWIFFNLVRY
jgi:hypothetical protein